MGWYAYKDECCGEVAVSTATIRKEARKLATELQQQYPELSWEERYGKWMGYSE